MGNNRIDVVVKAMQAWGQHDIDGVINCVTDDIEWHYHVGSRPVKGVATMRKMLERLQSHQTDLDWRLKTFAETDNGVLIEAVDAYTSAEGHRVQVPYMGSYEFEGSRISAWRDYVDMGLMTRAQAGEPLDEWIEALVTDSD